MSTIDDVPVSGHERRDVSPSAIVKWGAGVIGLVLFTVAAMWVVLLQLQTSEERHVVDIDVHRHGGSLAVVRTESFVPHAPMRRRNSASSITSNLPDVDAGVSGVNDETQ